MSGCRYCAKPLPDAPGGSRGKRGRAHYCSTDCLKAWDAERKITKPLQIRTCMQCSREFWTAAQARTCSARCRSERAKDQYDPARDKAKRDRRQRALRLRHHDVTPAHIRYLYRTTKECPLCSATLTTTPCKANSREVDHILPINMGGTHTIGNLRVICRACNARRPKDGSDLKAHQPTLWALDAHAIGVGGGQNRCEVNPS